MPERMDFEAERFLTSPSQSVHTCVHTHTSTESFCCGCFYLFNYYFIFIIPQIFIECLLYPSTLLDSSRHSNEKPQKFLPLWSLYPSRNVPLSFLLEMGSKRGYFLGIPVGKKDSTFPVEGARVQSLVRKLKILHAPWCSQKRQWYLKEIIGILGRCSA